MWLLDANMDVHLLNVLSELRIPCESAIRRGWQELSNGDLILAAVEAGFTCILTKDRLFAESSNRTMGAPCLAIIVVNLPQGPWRDYVRQFRTAWDEHPIAPVPGEVICWPSD
jgi:predicted nuclease of predicted toxin-antitoxin system